MTSFADLRTSIYNVALWQHLASDSNAAASVKSLVIKRIQPSRTGPVEQDVAPAQFKQDRVDDSLIPPETGAEDKEAGENRKNRVAAQQQAEQALIAALPKLNGLESFTWFHTPPVYDASYGRPASGANKDIWSALAAGGSVKNVNVVDEAEWPRQDLEGGSADWLLPIEGGAIWDSLSNLKSFSLITDSWRQRRDLPPRSSQERIVSFLSRSPALQSLKLDYELIKLRSDSSALSIPGDALVEHLASSPIAQTLQSLTLGDINVSSAAIEKLLRAAVNLESITNEDHISESTDKDLVGQGQITQIVQAVKKDGGATKLKEVVVRGKPVSV